jgi:hypothetical protein
VKGVTADIGFGDLAKKVEKKGQRSEVSEGSGLLWRGRVSE